MRSRTDEVAARLSVIDEDVVGWGWSSSRTSAIFVARVVEPGTAYMGEEISIQEVSCLCLSGAWRCGVSSGLKL